MADTSIVDDLLIEIETRFQRIRNDIGKLDQTQFPQKENLQNEIQTQFDSIQSKISELRAGVKSLDPNTAGYYQSEVNTIYQTQKQLISEFHKRKSLSANDPSITLPTEQNETKAEKIVQKIDDTIHSSAEVVSKKLDVEIKQIESRLQHVKNDLDRLDQCLPSQRALFQSEIRKQIDIIQSKINKVSNASQSLTPKESTYYSDRAKSLSAQCEQHRIDLANKETPFNDFNTKTNPEVPIERSINIESINDIIDQNEETPERKCFNPCLNNYIIWTIVIILTIALGFSIFWKLRK